MSKKKMIYIHGYYHVEQVAEIMGVNQETVRRWIRSGKLHAIPLRCNKDGYKVYGKDLADFKKARELMKVDKSKKPDRCQFCQSEDEFNDNIITSAAKSGSHVIVGAEAFVENGCLSLYLANANDDYIAMDTVKIKYCPMCGRRL